MMISWTNYFVALFLAADWDTALNVYESIIQMTEENKDNKDKKDMHLKPFEVCELHIMKARILEGKKEYKQAIKFVTKKTIWN